MTNSTTHYLSAFLKPNGYIVFAATNFSDKATITLDLQAQYGGGSVIRQFALNLPPMLSGAMIRMVSEAIVRAGYPPINAQLQLIDDVFAPEAIAA